MRRECISKIRQTIQHEHRAVPSLDCSVLLLRRMHAHLHCGVYERVERTLDSRVFVFVFIFIGTVVVVVVGGFGGVQREYRAEVLCVREELLRGR